MTIEIKARKLPDHLRVDCTGSFSLDAALAADAGRDALLIDARNVSGREPSLAERYEVAVRIADLQAAQAPRIRLSVFGHEPLIHRERFGEIVAANRGALARVFTDERAALAWLLAAPKTR